MECLAIGGDARPCDLRGSGHPVTLTDEHLESLEMLDLRLHRRRAIGEQPGLAECDLGLREPAGQARRMRPCLLDAQDKVSNECVTPGALRGAHLGGGLPLGKGLQACPLRDDVMGE